jgi:putative DNA primase/helicase
MMAITAPTPGTGKTLLAETFSILASNRRASVLSLGHDDAEAEKRLSGVLLAGDACILLDNIERPLKGDLLCQVLSQPSVRLRPLGASGMVSIPTHALMVATGNNLAIVGDLKRRVALIRMDAGTERPEQRSFKRDHLADVFARRGELIRAALIIPLAYLVAGAPAIEGLHPLGGFAEWDRMVRRPLAWLGLPDPLKAAEGLREQDPDLEATRQLFAAWREAFADKALTVAEVVTAGMATALMSSDRTHPELYDGLQLVCSEKPNTRRLGYWLRAHRDRIVDGMQLRQAGRDGHAKVVRWRVVTCG